jgi:hypothetical protein
MSDSGIKDILRAVHKATPPEDFGTGDLVHKDEVKEELKEVRDKTALLEKLGKYNRAEDLINDFSLKAAKRTVIEMEFGKTSADRLKAAESILNRSLGKPIERIANIGMEVSQYSEQELDGKLQELLKAFGVTIPNTPRFTSSDPNAAIYMETPKSSDEYS